MWRKLRSSRVARSAAVLRSATVSRTLRDEQRLDVVMVGHDQAGNAAEEYKQRMLRDRGFAQAEFKELKRLYEPVQAGGVWSEFKAAPRRRTSWPTSTSATACR